MLNLWEKIKNTPEKRVRPVDSLSKLRTKVLSEYQEIEQHLEYRRKQLRKIVKEMK